MVVRVGPYDTVDTMRIDNVRIRNFRGIRSLDLELGGVTVLIGENNTGKTSVLDALRLCLREVGIRSRSVIEGLDFHLAESGSEPNSADPIEIEIGFSERSDGEWDASLVSRMTRLGMIQVDDSGRGHVRLRVRGEYDHGTREFTIDWSLLDGDGQSIPRRSGQLAVLRDGAPYYYLAGLRDAADHFDSRKGRFWKPFLTDSQLSVDQKEKIEAKLLEVNELVVSSHTSFDHVRAALEHVQSVIPLGLDESVSIEAVPSRMFDLLAKAQVQMGAGTGAKIPLDRHGDGTQSLAVLMLFFSFVRAHNEGSPILALEEPEAHLHPSAVRAMWQLIKDFDGQKVISTHSGDFVAETDICDVRRLARTGSGIWAFRVPRNLLSSEETRKFNYHIRQVRGELLFARCWLLVEGESEAWVYPAAAHALGRDLDREGVRVVEYGQSEIGMLVKVANELGIQWYCIGDDDGNRRRVEPKVKANLGRAAAADRYDFPYPNLEDHLKENGYQDIYSSLGLRKPRAAASVAEEMRNRGAAGVTGKIRSVVEKAISLARGDDP